MLTSLSRSKWTRKISVSIVDQAVLSGSNFALNILIARFLSPKEYGIYVLAFSVFSFALGFYTALILEPMSIFGSTKFKKNFSRYLKHLVYFHFLITSAASIVLVCVLFFVEDTSKATFAAVSVAVPWMLLFWIFRQACYVFSKPSIALKITLIYSVTIFTGLALLINFDDLSVYKAFLLLGFSGGLASFWGWRYCIKGLNKNSIRRSFLEMLSIGRIHWKYGKWVAGNNIIYWSSNAIFLPLIAIFSGLEQAGGYRAMSNLTLPADQTLTVLNLLLLPWASRKRKQFGNQHLKQIILRIVFSFVLFSSVYSIVVLLLGKNLIFILYNSEEYNNYAFLLKYVVLIFFISSISQGIAIGIRALERPDIFLRIRLIAAAFTLTVGVYLTKEWGIYGASIASVLNMLIGTLASVLYFSRLFDKKLCLFNK